MIQFTYQHLPNIGIFVHARVKLKQAMGAERGFKFLSGQINTRTGIFWKIIRWLCDLMYIVEKINNFPNMHPSNICTKIYFLSYASSPIK